MIIPCVKIELVFVWVVEWYWIMTVCNITFDTPSNSKVWTFMPYQAVIVGYNGSKCIASGRRIATHHWEAQHLPLVYSSHHQRSVSARGAVPAEEFCQREVETESRKKPEVYLLLGILPWIGIGSIQDPAGLDLGHLDVKVGRTGDTGDRRWSGSQCRYRRGRLSTLQTEYTRWWRSWPRHSLLIY